MTSIRCFDQIQVLLRKATHPIRGVYESVAVRSKKYDWENVGAYLIVRSYYFLLSRKPQPLQLQDIY